MFQSNPGTFRKTKQNKTKKLEFRPPKWDQLHNLENSINVLDTRK